MHVIILGDVHLGRSLSQGKIGIGSTLNSRINDQLNLLDWVLDQALEKNIDNIILTGDIFEEPRPHPSIITMFIAWLKKCQAYQINIHMILGNHDMLRSGNVFTSSLDIISEVDLDNVSVYKHIDTILIGSSAFTLMPFRDKKSFSVVSNADALATLKETLTYELAGIPVTYKKFVIGHFAIEGSIPVGDEIDDIANELFCPIEMFKDYDYVWMGHVHKPQVMNKKSPYIAHIGSMDISNFGETDHKKHIVIVNCDSTVDGFEIEYLPTRTLKKYNINVPKDVDSTDYVMAEISKDIENINDSIVKVEVLLSVPELKSVNKSLIEKHLMDLGAFIVMGVTESKKVALLKKDINKTIDIKMEVPSTIKTYADIHVDPIIKDSFIELSMEIFSSYKEDLKD